MSIAESAEESRTASLILGPWYAPYIWARIYEGKDQIQVKGFQAASTPRDLRFYQI